jgi:hypothetical protein
MAREGGYEWYQSIGIIFLYISADFKNFFKGPRPFKKTKNVFERINNSSWGVTGSWGVRGWKMNSGAPILWILRYTGVGHVKIILVLWYIFVLPTIKSVFHRPCKVYHCPCTAPAAPNYPSIEKLIQWLIGPSPSLSATTDRPTVTGPDSKGVRTRSYLFN